VTGKTRWLNSTVLGIGAASLLSDLSHEVVTALLPALLVSMGTAAAALGTIEGLADGLSSAAKLLGGLWADRLKNRKPLCASGYATMAAATALTAAAGHWSVVLAGRGLAWIARGVRTPARKSLLADAVTPDAYGRAFGLERTMDTCGAVMAPLAALALLDAGIGISTIMWLAVIPAALAAFSITAFVREQRERLPKSKRFLATLYTLPSEFKRLLAGIGLFGAGDFAHSFMTLYAVTVLTPRYGAAAATAWSVGLYALHNVIYAGISYPAGILADRRRKRPLLAGGYSFGVAASLLLAFAASSISSLVAIFVLGGLCNGVQETLEDSYAAELVPQESHGAGFGTLAVVNGLGDFVSSITVGWLWHALGPSAAFGFSAATMAAGMVLTLSTGPQ